MSLKERVFIARLWLSLKVLTLGYKLMPARLAGVATSHYVSGLKELQKMLDEEMK